MIAADSQDGEQHLEKETDERDETDRVEDLALGNEGLPPGGHVYGGGIASKRSGNKGALISREYRREKSRVAHVTTFGARTFSKRLANTRPRDGMVAHYGGKGRIDRARGDQTAGS